MQCVSNSYGMQFDGVAVIFADRWIMCQNVDACYQLNWMQWQNRQNIFIKVLI